jgi:uncharacterized phage protein gp47/JayE
MPVIGGEYHKYTEDEIAASLEQNLEDLLDMTAEPGDLVTAQLQAEARTLADYIEEALERVYEAAYLEDASGKELEKLVQIIGLERQEASPATGTARFSRDTPPTSTYTIPRGTEIQTGGNDPIPFEVTESSALYHIDGFEDSELNGWESDQSGVSVVSTNEMTGYQALELPDTSGVSINTTDTYQIGKVFGADIRPQGATVTGFQFGRQDGSNYFEAILDANNNAFKLREVDGGAEERIETADATINADETIHVSVEWSLYGDHRATIYETSEKQTEIQTLYLEDRGRPQWRTGSVGLVSKDSNNTTLVDEVSNSGTTLNIVSLEQGVHTNLSADAIDVISSGLSGISQVTNPVPTGDETFLNTDFSYLVTGTDRETDEELRERAFDNTSIGGSATIKSIKTEINRVEGVQSLTFFQNKTEEMKDGLPSHSWEAVVYGGGKRDIAQAIHDSTSIDSQDVGGVHGTKVTQDIEDGVMNEVVTYRFSRPAEISLEITLELVVDDTYVGDEEIISRIVDYIGGTDVDGTAVPGIDVGEDLYVAVLEREIVNPSETGVWEVDAISIDKDGDGTDDITTLSSGAEAVQIADSEVAEANGRDGSITINTAQR